jgi:hypothetical protein
VGHTLVHAIGHPEWACDSEQVFVRKAVELGGNPELLQNIRKKLRQEMLCSQLCDGTDMALAIEVAFKSMCEERYRQEALRSGIAASQNATTANGNKLFPGNDKVRSTGSDPEISIDMLTVPSRVVVSDALHGPLSSLDLDESSTSVQEEQDATTAMVISTIASVGLRHKRDGPSEQLHPTDQFGPIKRQKESNDYGEERTDMDD